MEIYDPVTESWMSSKKREKLTAFLHYSKDNSTGFWNYQKANSSFAGTFINKTTSFLKKNPVIPLQQNYK